ncbi:hypothetical protein JTB14_023745 [Gonioctena quinquepunctata]|nr:hypothetical protein JTB14_023745 [Gonioctena quinquepunctata]
MNHAHESFSKILQHRSAAHPSPVTSSRRPASRLRPPSPHNRDFGSPFTPDAVSVSNRESDRRRVDFAVVFTSHLNAVTVPGLFCCSAAANYGRRAILLEGRWLGSPPRTIARHW